MYNFFQRLFLYTASILHIPWTIIRVIISITLLVDLWCDKVINNWLENLNKEIND